MSADLQMFQHFEACDHAVLTSLCLLQRRQTREALIAL